MTRYNDPSPQYPINPEAANYENPTDAGRSHYGRDRRWRHRHRFRQQHSRGGGGGKVAEAYDGYAYQSRICQEYGRQPRRYQVREPIPGSDWRNDGGWAIVLERGTYIIPAYTYYARSAGTLILNVNIANTAVHYNYPVTVGDGRTAYVQNVANPTFAIIDRNGDRVINTSDAVSGNSYQTVAVTSGTAPESYAGSLYIRWANMAWCR